MVFSKDPSGSGQHVQKNQLCEKLVLIDQLNGLHAKNQVSIYKRTNVMKNKC